MVKKKSFFSQEYWLHQKPEKVLIIPKNKKAGNKVVKVFCFWGQSYDEFYKYNSKTVFFLTELYDNHFTSIINIYFYESFSNPNLK